MTYQITTHVFPVTGAEVRSTDCAFIVQDIGKALQHSNPRRLAYAVCDQDELSNVKLQNGRGSETFNVCEHS